MTRTRERLPSSYLASGLDGRETDCKGGRQVVALRRIVVGEIVAIFGGSVIDTLGVKRLRPAQRRRTLQIEDDYFIVSNVDGPADWINHSCEPSCGLRGATTLVALREIAEGEEITFDYAMSDGSSYDEFECACGTPSCRGFVSGSDWARPDLRERYDGYFSPYLQRRQQLVALRMAERESENPQSLVEPTLRGESPELAAESRVDEGPR